MISNLKRGKLTLPLNRKLLEQKLCFYLYCAKHAVPKYF